MSLSRARAYQEQQQKEAAENTAEKIFQLHFTKAGDASTSLVICLSSNIEFIYQLAVNYPKRGDTVCL